MQYMSVSHGYGTIGGIEYGGCGEDKKKEIVSHQLACSRRPRAIRGSPSLEYAKPSSIMKNSHQYMKVTTQETLYHEDRGATFNHKCGKMIVTLCLLSFSLIFYLGFFGLFYFLFFIFIWSLIPTYGGIIVSIILSSLGTML